ncbi:MAG: hypothetical protein ACI8R4_000534 [Paracoccaceae bacterium]|jgi:hypothetical protein
MAFPAKVFCSILEVAARWNCSLTQVVNYAISDEIDLVAGFARVRLDGKCAAGLLSVPGSEVRPLFRPFGKGHRRCPLGPTIRSISWIISAEHSMEKLPLILLLGLNLRSQSHTEGGGGTLLTFYLNATSTFEEQSRETA